MTSLPRFVAVASVLALLTPVAAGAADPVEFARISGICPASQGTHTLTASEPVPTAHPDVLTLSSGLDATDSAIPSGVWGTGPALAAGETPTATCEGNGLGSYYVSVGLYDRPLAPATFRGGGGLSAVGIVSPTLRGHEIVVERISNGMSSRENPITVVLPDGTSRTVTSASEVLDLGAPAVGRVTALLQLRAGTGGWRATIRHRPGRLSGPLVPAASVIRPGTGTAATFTLDGDAGAIGVTASSPRGVIPIATLGPLGPGVHTTAWDGRDPTGRPVPDGIYRLDVVADPGAGAAASRAFASLTVDGTPPRVVIENSARTPRRPVRVTVGDPGNRQVAAYTVDGGPPVAIPAGAETVDVPAPRGGWRLGSRRLRVVASDAVGNPADVTRTFAVTEDGSPPIACGRGAVIDRLGRDATLRSRLGAKDLGTLTARTRLASVTCRDLTGDRVRDAVALFAPKGGRGIRAVVVLRGRRSGILTTALADRRIGARRISRSGKRTFVVGARGTRYELKRAGTRVVLRRVAAR